MRAFTVRHDALSRVLRTRGVKIGNNRALAVDQPTIRDYSAIWDTGATHTCITTKVVAECGLIPTSVAEVTGIHGTQRTYGYLIDVYLPNQVVVRGVEAVESPALAGELDDVLIGMDIINLGDLAVSNFQGKTTFTFRIPSLEEFDFNPAATPGVGRNVPS